MKKKLVIWGASGHAMVVADIVRLQDEYELVGFLDSIHPERRGQRFCGGEILGGAEQLDQLLQADVNSVILGFGNNQARMLLAQKVIDLGFTLACAIHPATTIAHDVEIMAGTVIAAGAIINPKVVIGSNVIINTNASIDHECVIHNGVHISPGVCLGGKVEIGPGSWIGIGAVVVDHVFIGTGTIIGAGAVVIRDVPDHVVAYGNPCQVMRAADDAQKID